MKMMEWMIVSLLSMAMTTNIAEAQVTIGAGVEPHEDALLDLKEYADGSSQKGFLLPRVALQSTALAAPMKAHVKGMVVYNTQSTGSGTGYVSPGLYYNTGGGWERLHFGATNWFYMPSLPVATSAAVKGATLDLYSKYADQFLQPEVKSPSSPASVPYIQTADKLYYYVTKYDDSVFENVSVSDTGVMTYDVKKPATDYTFINVVFVLK